MTELALAPPVEPAAVRGLEDRFRCEPYRCVITARSCIGRRRRGNAAEETGEAYVSGPKEIKPHCATCEVGKDIEKRLGGQVAALDRKRNRLTLAPRRRSMPVDVRSPAGAPTSLLSFPLPKKPPGYRPTEAELRASGPRPEPPITREETVDDEDDREDEDDDEERDDDAGDEAQDEADEPEVQDEPDEVEDEEPAPPVDVPPAKARAKAKGGRTKPKASLDEEIVRWRERDEQIRAAYRGGANEKDLVKRFGLSRAMIYRIVKGEPRPPREGERVVAPSIVHRDVMPHKDVSLEVEIAAWREMGAALRSRVADRLAAVEEEAAGLRAAAAALDAEHLPGDEGARAARTATSALRRGEIKLLKSRARRAGKSPGRPSEIEQIVRGYLDKKGPQALRALLIGLNLDAVTVKNALGRMKRKGEVFLAGQAKAARWATSKAAAARAVREAAAE